MSHSRTDNDDKRWIPRWAKTAGTGTEADRQQQRVVDVTEDGRRTSAEA